MITEYMANRVQDYIFGGVSFTPPTVFYIALSKTEPQMDGTGVTEPTGGNYQRIAISRGSTTFTTAEDGTVKNKIGLQSNESTANWGNVPYYAIYDSLTGGNLLYGGEFVYERNIDIEMQLIIEANGIVFTLGS